MNDLRETIGNILFDHWKHNDKHIGDTADAIIAALPGMVPPLVWGDMEWGVDRDGYPTWGEFTDASTFTDMTECGSYAIYQFSETEFMWTQGTDCNMRFSTYRPAGDMDWVARIPWHPTRGAAKAAAQAHHVATILSAFGVQGGET